MTEDSAALRRRIEALQERMSGPCGAILRISESLDLDTVLQEIVDRARALTKARFGLITTIDEAGRPARFVSSGITADEHRQMTDWADGLRLFEHLRDLSEALRVRDVPGYLRSHGFSAEVLPYRTGQAAPIRHRGVHVGSLFVGEKEGEGGVHERGRRCARALCVAGGDGHRQRAGLPGRAAGPGRPAGLGGDLAGRRGGL